MIIIMFRNYVNLMQLFTVSYFPNIITTSLLLNSSNVVIEACENFIKQSYRSRCHVLGPNDILTLQVPVKGGRKNKPIKDILIDNSQRWPDIHWRSITSSYQKAPFFEYYEDFTRKIVFSGEEKLFNLSLNSMKSIMQVLQTPFEFELTDKYERDLKENDDDFRSSLNKKNTHPLPDIFTEKSYQQNFGKLFVPNLSTLDVIFCEGPQALEIIRGSTK